MLGGAPNTTFRMCPRDTKTLHGCPLVITQLFVSCSKPVVQAGRRLHPNPFSTRQNNHTATGPVVALTPSDTCDCSTSLIPMNRLAMRSVDSVSPYMCGSVATWAIISICTPAHNSTTSSQLEVQGCNTRCECNHRCVWICEHLR